MVQPGLAAGGLSDLPAGKHLLAASTGGHLAQLVALSQRWVQSEDSLWVTFESEQSTSLLRDKRVLYLPYIAPRDWRGVVRAMRSIQKVVKAERFESAVSTGAALALAVLPVARAYGLPARYVESISRTDGPSLTGRILHRARIGETYTQHARWAGPRWPIEPPVLANFVKVDQDLAIPEQLKIFVTLGTIRPYRFDSLVDALLRAAPDADYVWQLGETVRRDLPGHVTAYMDSETFWGAAARADVVVTHAGVGTILSLLNRGISPVVVPRRRSRSEHVDDHQLQIFQLLKDLDVAVPVEVAELSRQHLDQALMTTTLEGDE